MRFNLGLQHGFILAGQGPGLGPHHGVGFDSNFTEDVDAGGGTLSFSQKYPGLRSVIAGGNPLYVDDRATIASPLTAGSLGGDYKVQAGSPARNLLPSPLLKFDINGNARGSGAQHAGSSILN